MTARTSISKARLEQLESIGDRYEEMVQNLLILANNPEALKNFSDRKAGLDVSIQGKHVVCWS